MINGLSITAVIPVRAGSRRVPNKNIRPFGNSSLLERKIRQLKEVKEIDTIVVSSDSDIMLDIAKNNGVETQKRPLEYCDEITKSFNEVVEYVACNVKGDIIMWTPCVSPFTNERNYKIAINLFQDFVINTNEYDSLIGCRLFKEFLFDESKPINFTTEKHVPSQFLPNWHVLGNSVYMSKRTDMITKKYFYGKKPYLYELSKIESLDIDDLDDFEICEAILELQNKKNNNI